MEGIKEAEVTIEGAAPLLMSNPQTLDELNPYTIAIKKITSLHHSKKTQDLLAKIAKTNMGRWFILG